MKYTTQELKDLLGTYTKTLYPNSDLKFKKGSEMDMAMRQSTALATWNINNFLSFVDKEK